MGMHVTIHGKNDTPFNGADGSWQPIKVNTNGQLSIAMLSGEIAQYNRMAGGAIVQYTQITTNATTIISNVPAILYGIQVITGGTTSTVTVYDNSAASGTLLINAGATTTSGSSISAAPGSAGLLLSTGITVVTAGAAAAVINVYYVSAV